jgi:hypothetical protein
MVIRGQIHNGVVALPDGIRLPEGQEVTVLVTPMEDARTHGVLDIPPVSLGRVVSPPSADEDRLGEMLEGRA